MGLPSEHRRGGSADPRRGRRRARQQLKREMRAMVREYDAAVKRDVRRQKRAGVSPYEWTLSAEALALAARAQSIGRQLGGLYGYWGPVDAPDSQVDARGRDRGVTS